MEGTDGFMVETDFEHHIRNQHRDSFELARRVNRRCHKLIFDEVDLKNRDGQGVLVSTLFLRVLQHFQAALILLEKGMVASAKVAVRAELEATFTIRAAAASLENTQRIVADNVRERVDLAKKVRTYGEKYPILKQSHEAMTEEAFDTLKAQAQSLGATAKLTTKELSEMAELHDLYVSVYAMLSRATHSLVGDVDSYLLTGEDGDVREIDYAPQLDETKLLIIEAADFALMASDAVTRHFDLPELGDARTELHEFMLATA